ncbi:hypothetical protein Dimus_023686 [Dionaea muscipula]
MTPVAFSCSSATTDGRQPETIGGWWVGYRAKGTCQSVKPGQSIKLFVHTSHSSQKPKLSSTMAPMEDPSSSAMTRMEPPETPLLPITAAVSTAAFDGMASIGEDILHNILSKLPAQSFASAACVSRTWNAVCGSILSRPKFASALSLNPSLQDALQEIVEQVLSEPIRPHFAILTIEYTNYVLEEAHRLIDQRFNSSIPIITSEASGIIGRDAKTDEFREVKFEFFDAMPDIGQRHRRGILLTVGYVPGLKIDLIPLLHRQGPMIDKFVMDIRDFTSSVSDSKSPEAILMFGDPSCDMKPVLSKMDHAMSKESIVVGNEGGRFKHTSCHNQSSICSSARGYDAVALVFARDKAKFTGQGKIQFLLSMGAGIAAVGPAYKAASVKVRNHEYSTWITAKREGLNHILDGHQILDDLDNELEDDIDSDLFVGVTKRRKCSFGSEKVIWKTSLAYHHVLDVDEQYLYLRALDIKTGDSFRFHVPDQKIARSSCSSVSESFRMWKQLQKIDTCQNARSAALNRGKEVIGAFIFTCCGRGESFFGEPNVDSSPILDNFPGIPLAGMFCCGEISRGPLISSNSGGQEASFTESCVHVYSAVYLVLTYDPSPCMP